jgi:hypothetical protein
MAAHKALALSATLALAVLCAALLLLPAAEPVEARAVSGERDATCGGTYDWNSGFSGEFRAQTFTAARTGKITNARVRLSRLGNATGGVIVQIRRLDSGGAPDATVLASTKIPNTAISTSSSFRNAIAHFPRGSRAQVTAGNPYALVMRARFGYYVAGTNAGCPGGFYFAPSSGSPFQSGSDDLLFSVYVAGR